MEGSSKKKKSSATKTSSAMKKSAATKKASSTKKKSAETVAEKIVAMQAVIACLRAVSRLKEQEPPKKAAEPIIEEPIVEEPMVDYAAEKKKAWASFIEDETIKADVAFSVEDQEQHFGLRTLPPLRDGSILQQRLGWTKKYGCKEKRCTLLVEADGGKTVGILPHLRLDHVWRMAEAASGNKAEKKFKITERVFKTNSSAVATAVRSHPDYKGTKEKRSVIVQDLFLLTEKEYSELYLPDAKEFIDVLRAAIREEIAECVRLKKNWHKIKRYSHKISLSEVFNASDRKILQANGIRCLNDLRKRNVYDLKNMLLDHAFSDIIKEINDAFKEDKQRRKDRRHQIVPFAVAFPVLAVVTFWAYKYRYTIIKNPSAFTVILLFLAVWFGNVIRIIWACIRAKLRRKKRPKYFYFTRNVRKATILLGLFSLFTVGSVTLFHERYDGYDDTVYYRDVEDGKIAVAGLVNEETDTLYIPETIDGKTVAKIDRGAFHHDEFSAVSIPTTVTEIADCAFVECDNLRSISLPQIEKIPARLCDGCDNLAVVTMADGVTVIEEKAFKNCVALQSLQLPATVTEIGAGAFENCESLNEIDFANVEKVGRVAFKNCTSLTSIALEKVVSIDKYAFEKCERLREVALGDDLQTIGKNAFKQCNSVQTAVLPFFGRERAKAANGTLQDVFPALDEDASLALVITDCEKIYKANLKKAYGLAEIVLGDVTTEIEEGAFSGLKSLSVVRLPSSLTRIEKETFAECYRLQTIIGGDNVTYIGEKAFAECESLIDTNFSKVERIESQAFARCGNLRQFGKFSTVRSIGTGAFVQAGTLCESGVSLSNVSIGDSAFSDSSVEQVTLKGTVSIGNGAFSAAAVATANMQNATISSFGEYVFSQCTHLSTVNLPAALRAIPAKTFDSCSALRSVTIPNNVTSIGASAYRACRMLETIVIPDFVTEIGEGAFSDCFSLKTVTMPSLTSYDRVFAKSFVVTLTLTKATSLPARCLQGVTSLKTLSLPDNLTEIGDEALQNCNNLSTLQWPSSLRTIGESAFDDCKKLSSADFSVTSLRTIGKTAFRNCVALRELNLNVATLTTIGERAFSSAANIQSIQLSASELQSLGDYAFERAAIEEIDLSQTKLTGISAGLFSHCLSLVGVIYPDGVQTIGDRAFEGCGFTSVSIPDTVTSIGSYAFSSCYNVATLTIPDSVTSIGDFAFWDCDYVITLTVPNSVLSIGSGAFSDMENLRTVTVPFLGKSRTSDDGYDSVFGSEKWLTSLTVTDMANVTKSKTSGAKYVESITLQGNVTEIGDEAFAEMKLTSISFPNTLEKIGNGAFRGASNLQSISLSHTKLRFIGNEAFKNCTSLGQSGAVIMPSTLETIGDEAFYGNTCLKIVFSSNSELHTVGDWAFAYCTSMAELRFQQKLQSFGKNVCVGCTKLQEITFPEELKGTVDESQIPAGAKIIYKDIS